MISPEIQDLLNGMDKEMAQSRTVLQPTDIPSEKKPVIRPEVQEILDGMDREMGITSETTSALGVAGREAVENIVPAGVGLATALVGGKAGAAIGTAITPGIGTAIGAGVGAIGGYIAGEYGGAKFQRWMQELTMSPEELAAHDILLAKGKQEHPYAAGIGGMAASTPGFFVGGGAGKAVITGGKAVKTGLEVSKARKLAAGIVSSATSFGAMGGGGVAVEKERETPGAESLNIPEEVIKGIVVGGSLGLVPGFKNVYGKFFAKPAADALALSTANGVYDRITKGKPFNPEEVIKESGQNIAPFLVMNVVMNVLHGRTPSVKGEIPLELTKPSEKPISAIEKPSEMPLERPIVEEGIPSRPPTEIGAEMPAEGGGKASEKIKQLIDEYELTPQEKQDAQQRLPPYFAKIRQAVTDLNEIVDARSERISDKPQRGERWRGEKLDESNYQDALNQWKKEDFEAWSKEDDRIKEIESRFDKKKDEYFTIKPSKSTVDSESIYVDAEAPVIEDSVLSNFRISRHGEFPFRERGKYGTVLPEFLQEEPPLPPSAQPQITELKPLLEHPIPYYVIADKVNNFNTVREFEDFVKYARVKSFSKKDEWTNYDFEKQFGSIKNYFEWVKSDKDNIKNVVGQYEKIIDKLNIDEKTKTLWKKDPEAFELNYETSKIFKRPPPPPTTSKTAIAAENPPLAPAGETATLAKPEVEAGALFSEKDFNDRLDTLRKLPDETGKKPTEGELRTDLETSGVVKTARWKEMTPEEQQASITHLDSQIEAKSVGAAALNKLELATTTFAEPGEKRLRGIIKLVEKSPIISDETKLEVKKFDQEYEQQRTKAMKDSVLEAMTQDSSIAKEAETYVRNPKEPLDTKGAISVALLEHYRNTGNDAAATDLLNFNADLALGAGRYNQAFSMMNKLSGKDWITEMNTYLTRKGAELPEDVRVEIERKFTETAKIKDEKARAAAIHEIITEVSTYIPFKAGEWIDAYRYTNMLFNPQSHLRNVYGNTVQALITRPLSLIARGDLSGAKTYMAGVWQNVMSGEGFRVAMESFKKSEFGKFAESLENPNATIFDEIRMEAGPQGKRKSLAWKWLTFIPKLLNAQDKLFGSWIEAGEMARLIKDGETVTDAQASAHLLAEKYLYRERLGQKRDKSLPIFSQALDGLANLIEAGRTTENPYVRWPMKLTVPFLRTPIRIAQMSVEASPLAWIGSGMNVENIARAKYGKTYSEMENILAKEQAKSNPNKELVNKTKEQMLLTREEFNNRVGLASVGTMVTLMGIGAAIQGSTTWGVPQDPEAKKRFYASGRRPYCFNPIGTNKWIPLAYLGPFFLAFALPAAARDAFADNPSAVDESMITRLGLAAAGIPKIILSQTPISGVSGLLEALQGKVDKNMATAIGFEGSQFIPTSGLLRWVNKMVDPIYRHPVSIGESIKAGIPGLSKDLKAYLDTGNKDAQRPWTDVYLPYTIGEVDKQKEREFQNKVSQLKAKIKLQNILNANKEKVRKATQSK